MGTTKKIMVAVDFSEYSSQVVEHAGGLAKDLGAELILVNVINQRDIDMIKEVAAHTDKITVKGYIEDLTEERTNQIQSLLEETGCRDIPNRFIIRKGVPFVTLIETAKAERADMVVMGAKGRGNIASMLLGSQAEKMFRHCPVPLLSIREKQE